MDQGRSTQALPATRERVVDRLGDRPCQDAPETAGIALAQVVAALQALPESARIERITAVGRS